MPDIGISRVWWEKPLPKMDLSWMDDALCREIGPEIFFPEVGDREGWVKARQICSLCDVRMECLEYALAQPRIEGVLAGTTQRQRERMSASRNRSIREQSAKNKGVRV